LVSWRPGTAPGDTTPWLASMWEFCARYCTARFGEAWHLSPEQSLLLHAEQTVLPQQIVVYAPKGANNTINLLLGTSLYDLRQKDMPPAADLMERNGLRLFTPEAALIKIPEAFFSWYPVEAHVVLSGIRDASDILGRLLDGGHSVFAGRLAGAFRRVDRPRVADEIIGAKETAGYAVREVDPFAPEQTFGTLHSGASPIVLRLQALWETCRELAIAAFPQPPGRPKDRRVYMHFVDDIYQSDAYHSLSIEGYRVTSDLIERVRSGNWNSDNHDADRQSRDALAARGYWQAFQRVRDAVDKIIAGADAGPLARDAHRDWYRELFQPCVAAGLIAPSALAGYRNDAVYLRGSYHVPPRWDSVRDAMPALFDLIEKEPEPSVRAVLGHWLFGYIHPYPDGNERMARFLMNAMLASGGYPWTVIRGEDRDAYLAALETASVQQNIAPFAGLVAERVRWSLEKAA